MQLSSGKTFGGMLFADDFVGVSDSKESLQKLIDVVYSYCSKWRLQANVIKSAVMVFSKDAVNGCWEWGEHIIVFQKYLLIVIYVHINQTYRSYVYMKVYIHIYLITLIKNNSM